MFRQKRERKDKQRARNASTQKATKTTTKQWPRVQILSPCTSSFTAGQQFVQQRRRYPTLFGDTQRTTRPGNEPVENTSEHQRTSPGASRIRHRTSHSKTFVAHSKACYRENCSLFSSDGMVVSAAPGRVKEKRLPSPTTPELSTQI